MIDFSTLKALPVRNDHDCFACGQSNPIGIKMKFFTDEKAVYSRICVPRHLCGWQNMIHGGIVATIMDEIMGWTAIYLAKRIILTKSMSVEFLKPTYVGETVVAKGIIHEIPHEREAVIEGMLFDHNEEICARAKGVFALFTPEAMREKGLISEAALAEFTPIFVDMGGEKEA